MRKKRYSVEQIVAAVQQHEAGMSVAEPPSTGRAFHIPLNPSTNRAPLG